MRKTKVVLLNIVSVMTIASLVTGCCGGLEEIAPALDYDESAWQDGTQTAVPDEEYDSGGYAAGEYSIQHTEQTQRSTQVTYPYATFSDYSAEVDVRFADDVDFTLGGLLFRWQDNDNHYGFLAWNNGQYGLFKRVNGEFEELVNESSPYLNSGVSANRLKVVVVGDLISLYINGQHVTWLTDTALREGRVGLHATVHSESPVSTQVYFDNLRVSGPEETSAVLFEDDFSDPGSGWPVEAYAYGSVGYVAGPGAVEVLPAPTEIPFEPIEIVSKRELTTEEFFESVEGDEIFADVYALAVEEGYTEPQGGGEFIGSDGSVLRGLALTSSEDDAVVAFSLERDERAVSFLARFEEDAEALVLYDRAGRAEITEERISVFDAAGSPMGETDLSESLRPPGLARSPTQDWYTCENPNPYGASWEDFSHCCLHRSGVARNQIGQCLAGVFATTVGLFKATKEASGWILVGALSVAFFTCNTPVVCMRLSGRDDAPTYEIKEPTRLEQPCRVGCMTYGTSQTRVTIPKYRIQVHIDDDRKPRPDTPRSVEVCAGDTEIMRIRDCAGHQIDLPLKAPGPTEADILQVCWTGEFCVLEANDARCVECRSGANDCPTGQSCIEGKCVTEEECVRDEDCDQDAPHCWNGDCVECRAGYDDCSHDEDCLNGICLRRQPTPTSTLEPQPVDTPQPPPEDEEAFNRLAQGRFAMYDGGCVLTVHKNEIRLGYPAQEGALFGTAHLQFTVDCDPDEDDPDWPAEIVDTYYTFTGTYTPPHFTGSFDFTVSVQGDGGEALSPLQERNEGIPWAGYVEPDGSIYVGGLHGGTHYYLDFFDRNLGLDVTEGSWTKEELTVD